MGNDQLDLINIDYYQWHNKRITFGLTNIILCFNVIKAILLFKAALIICIPPFPNSKSH